MALHRHFVAVRLFPKEAVSVLNLRIDRRMFAAVMPEYHIGQRTVIDDGLDILRMDGVAPLRGLRGELAHTGVDGGLGLLGAGRRVTPGIDLCAAKSGTREGELDTGRKRPVRAVKPKLLKNTRRESISKIVLDKVEKICYADGGAGRGGAAIRSHILVPGSLFMLVCIYGVDVPFLDTLQRFNVSYGSKVLLGSLHDKRYGVIRCLVFRQRKIQVLPRLALAYYCLIAAVLALVLGALWLSLRRKPCAALMRQLFFAPFAWLAAQLLLKGLDAASFQLEWELGWILLLALVIYSLLTLAWLVWKQHRSAA